MAPSPRPAPPDDASDNRSSRNCNEQPAVAAPGSTSWSYGQPMFTAPRDGTAFLATGTHNHSPPGAQRGVMAGDRWWAILLFDIWREPGRFVFAKDGTPPWSEPKLWCALPDLLPGSPVPSGDGSAGAALRSAVLALRSYEFGNSAPDLAKDIADHFAAVLRRITS